jgi:small ligand-binding sensory domain FIST
VRRVVSFDEETGAIVMGCAVRPGQRLRFVVAEETAAKNILHSTLQQFKKAELAKTLVGYSNPPLGALLFLDAGRGHKLFREPDYETREFAEVAPTLSASGLFTSVQIAPARPGAPATLHNASSVIAIIRNRSAISPSNPPESPTP